jgi:gamma-glutamylcyclotransferase (GGCT)/AIG2-like uncharacterized protein YtfP
MSHLFSYGSLMFADVISKVIGHTPTHRNATLADWARRAIPGQTYPAALPSSGSRIEGVLWCDLSGPDWQALDDFEGQEYRRVPVTVVCEGGERVQAHVYEWLDAQCVGESDWSPQDFDARHREDFYQIHGRPQSGSCRHD